MQILRFSQNIKEISRFFTNFDEIFKICHDFFMKMFFSQRSATNSIHHGEKRPARKRSQRGCASQNTGG